jgi:hypothetical protein
VYSAAGKDETLLTAENLTIRSTMGGDLGRTNNPLTMDVKTVNLYGNDIILVNNRSLLVDLILAMNVLNLKVNGNLDYIDSNNVLKGIYASVLDLSVSGNVGQNTQKPAASGGRAMFAANRNTQNGMLIDVDEISRLSAKDACLNFAKTVIVENIRSDGDLVINTEGAIHMKNSASAIYCNSMSTNAFGYAGTGEMPLKVYAKYGAEAESYLYGENLLVLPWGVGVSNGSNTPSVRVTGGIAPNAVVTVDTKLCYVDCAACEYLMMRALNEMLTYVHIHVDGEITDQVQVEIQVEDLEEGSEVIVLTCRDGVIYAIRAVVRNGWVTFLTDKLGAFLILNDEADLHLSEDGKFILTGDSGETLPFGGWL